MHTHKHTHMHALTHHHIITSTQPNRIAFFWSIYLWHMLSLCALLLRLLAQTHSKLAHLENQNDRLADMISVLNEENRRLKGSILQAVRHEGSDHASGAALIAMLREKHRQIKKNRK